MTLDVMVASWRKSDMIKLRDKQGIVRHTAVLAGYVTEDYPTKKFRTRNARSKQANRRANVIWLR